MSVDKPVQSPATCFSCHAIGVTSTSALGAYMFYRAKKADSSTHRFTCALIGLETSSTNESDPPEDKTNDQRSAVKTLIRYIMRTFYDAPKSLVVEYIYHYECINLEDLAKLLCLKSEKVYSYIQEFKRDQFIIEEHRRESNVGSNRRSNPNELYYQIDMPRFVNVVKYRLINIQFDIENFERQELYEQKNYKCQQCSKEYTDFDIGKLSQNNTQEDLLCTLCGGMINENNQTEQKRIRYNIRSFNEQTASLFEILKRIDQIMINEQSTRFNDDTEVINECYGDINVQLIRPEEGIIVKPLPEWFTRSTIDIESDQSSSSLIDCFSQSSLLGK